VADPVFANGGPRSSAEWPSAAGASIEAPKAPREVGFGDEVSPSPMGRRLERGRCPLPRKCFDFVSENGDF